MNDAEFDLVLKRLFLSFGGAIVLVAIFYIWRALKIYILGKRVRAVVTKVLKKEADPALTRSHPKYSYVLEYEDASGARRSLHERQELRYREFEVGDVVTVFLQSDREGEILSWRRLLLSSFLLALTSGGMLTAYYVLVVQKKG